MISAQTIVLIGEQASIFGRIIHTSISNEVSRLIDKILLFLRKNCLIIRLV